MTLKSCIENFPKDDTLIGQYELSQIKRTSDIEDIENWRYNPFWEDATCYSFIIFNPATKRFECWNYIFDKVSGYISCSGEYDDFFPVIYSEDFGYEKIDPWDPQFKDQVTTLDDELAMEMGWPLDEIKERKWRREQVAYLFDAESYLNGFTFTSAEALKKFVKEQKDLL